ncbi:uncharacterized protein LOC143152251 isoform X2 [Ptiloglossa arizonensis]|uniref:uncharacterized protein LOC143152251 isoform X2 n=1 Tax=Ptiloglossa arizonensis TaxID=3350558 RepID=UPI003FA10023
MYYQKYSHHLCYFFIRHRERRIITNRRVAYHSLFATLIMVRVTVLAIAVILATSTESKSIWSDFYIGNHQYPSAVISVQPQLLRYQVHTEDVKTIPATIVANEKPTISHLPAYSFYYGTPVYDFRFPLSPFYPALKPSEPSPDPKPTVPSTTSTESTEEKDDGLEKLDTKVEPEKEMKHTSDTEDKSNDDSITIESI